MVLESNTNRNQAQEEETQTECKPIGELDKQHEGAKRIGRKQPEIQQEEIHVEAPSIFFCCCTENEI